MEELMLIVFAILVTGFLMVDSSKKRDAYRKCVLKNAQIPAVADYCQALIRKRK